MDDQYWRKFRKRARKRANMLGVLVLSPFWLFILTLKILDPTSYPAGDVRNGEAFRLAVYGGLILVVLGIIVMAVRWFVLDRRQR